MKKIYVVLLALVLNGYGFAWDYTQNENFGLNPGSHVEFTVVPPKNARGDDAIVTKGYCDQPGGFVWVGQLKHWTATIPPEFLGQHNGHFYGEYGYPGTNGGQALTWQANTEAEVVKLMTITWATIPSDRTRRKLGVGEKVTLTLVGAEGNQVLWSLVGPGNIDGYSGSLIYFTAHERKSQPSVTAHYKGKLYTANFNVVEPDSESAIITSEDTYPPGKQGVGMHLKVFLHPTEVSFDWVEIRELPGPATNIQGYFIEHTPPSHNPPGWLPVGVENDTTDHARCINWPSPWYLGGYDWIIPMEWHVEDSANIATLPNRLQTHEITDESGRSIISKLGQSATNSP